MSILTSKQTVLIAVTTLVGAGYFTLSGSASPSANEEDRSSSPKVAAGSHSGKQDRKVARSRYELEYTRTILVGDAVADEMSLHADLQVEALAQLGRYELALANVTLSETPNLPQASAVLEPFQIATANQRIIGAGFVEGTEDAAKDLLINVATSTWYSAGHGKQWSVEEEDLTGRFESTYLRQQDGEVERTRRYTAMRSGDTWNATQAESVFVDGSTSFIVDEDGLASVQASESAIMNLGPQQSAEARIQVRLVRTEVSRVKPRAGAGLDIEPLRVHVTGPSAEDIDRARLANWNFDKLMTELDRLGEFTPGSDAEDRFRGGMLLHLRASARLEEGAAERMAHEILESDDMIKTSLLAGALGSANTPEATRALVDLVQNDALPSAAKTHIGAALAMTEAPSRDSVAALKSTLDDSDYAGTGALALGVQLKRLGNESGDAIDLLIARYQSAQSFAEKRTYLNALGNSGDPRVVEVVRNSLQDGDLRIAAVAAYALRFVASEEADILLQEVLAAGYSETVQLRVVAAVAYRSKSLWMPVLENIQSGASEQMAMAIAQTLSNWG